MLYGTTSGGGSASSGTIFSIDPTTGNSQILHTFLGTSTEGYWLKGGLASDGTYLYGTTNQGGANGWGTVFRVRISDGDFTTLHNFKTDPADIGNPKGNLLLVGSTLYGTAEKSGSPNFNGGYGGIFSIGTNGLGYQVLRRFTGSNSDGGAPYAGLITDGTRLYGTASSYISGLPNHGTVFSMNFNGSDFKLLHLFTDAEDPFAYPQAGLVLYGSTLYGTTDSGYVFAVDTSGNNYRVVRGVGGYPDADLTIVGSELYGTASYGGANQWGMVFTMDLSAADPGSTFSTAHSFNLTDGGRPLGGVILVDSTLYGTTSIGGSSGNGTIFSLVPLKIPSVTNASTFKNSLSTSGLVITPNPDDVGIATAFYITNITGGALYLNDGVTQISNGRIITLAQAQRA